ncbi:polysaccharide biosynthesis/export family protein [Flavihumibacter fluvii]|uniref:polysaccharide biosynthesis/export family protein n=1 Tax=Flavihumibacter fluvii TaxID=2838157 RepID=UPI001BDF6FA5|nr:polysaccharide biosynthesis/export family protein [Flavihumibacter fluvii]ULQ52389.1 polysaccharide biosynthesis/export family protein [Flavihumibacter fluvii]
MLKKLFQGAAIATALFLLGSCGASKKNHQERLLLQGIDTVKSLEVMLPQITIKKGDLLTIMVFSDNLEATTIYNQPQTGGGATTSSSSSMTLSSTGRGYLVDINGQIYFHSLGLINVEGQTKNQLANLLRDSLRRYLQNPYVTIRYTNARINLIGEVAKPGIIELSDQKINILDAIGFAGDFTPFGRRDNVLVVREVDGKRITGRLDVRSPEIYSSPFFYLQQNDLVYVEPNRKKPTGNEQVLMRNLAITTSILSMVTILVTLLTR